MKAFVFPGQGSQKPGMGAALLEQFSESGAWFTRANEVLGYDLQSLCLNGPAETLTDTRFAQPALLTVGALCHKWAQSRGVTAEMTAGHSLGEYTALVAAGALEFETALRLVQRRSELMAAAPAGTMAAIVGLGDDDVLKVLAAVSTQGLVVPANYNSPGQLVISGEVAAVEAAMAAAKSAGAKMTVKLPVSGAFHSPLLREAGAEMAELISAAPFRDAQFPVYQNTTAKAATRAADLQKALAAQMTSPVRWSETVRAMIGDGASHFYELGPGKVLSGLIGRIDKSVTTENSEC